MGHYDDYYHEQEEKRQRNAKERREQSEKWQPIHVWIKMDSWTFRKTGRVTDWIEERLESLPIVDNVHIEFRGDYEDVE